MKYEDGRISDRAVILFSCDGASSSSPCSTMSSDQIEAWKYRPDVNVNVDIHSEYEFVNGGLMIYLAIQLLYNDHFQIVIRTTDLYARQILQ